MIKIIACIIILYLFDKNVQYFPFINVKLAKNICVIGLACPKGCYQSIKHWILRKSISHSARKWNRLCWVIIIFQIFHLSNMFCVKSLSHLAVWTVVHNSYMIKPSKNRSLGQSMRWNYYQILYHRGLYLTKQALICCMPSKYTYICGDI